MFKNLLSKNNINLCKNIINTKTYSYIKIALTTKSNFNLRMIQSFQYSENYSQNIKRGKFDQRKSKSEYPKENRFNANSDNYNSSKKFSLLRFIKIKK